MAHQGGWRCDALDLPENGEIHLGAATLVSAYGFSPPAGVITYAGLAPNTHPLLFTGMTLADNCNVIRGIEIPPTRASGWTSFTGTITDSPAAVYSDYRELHTGGTGEVLGAGFFPYMDSGAVCKSLFAIQAISYVSAGSTVDSAADAPGIGVFPIWAKCVLDGETFTSGGVAAAMFLSVQANVTDVQAEDTSMLNMEVASGGIQNIIKFRCTTVNGATYFVNLADNGEPGEKTVASETAVDDVVGNIKVLIGDQVGYINVHSAKAS